MYKTLAIIIGVLVFATSATAQHKPLEVRYGMFVRKVNPDFKKATFNAEFYWWAIFEIDTLATGIGTHEMVNFEYVNAVNAEVDGAQKEIQEFRPIGKNKYYCTGFHQGDFYFNPDFRRYPLDIQALNIIVENSLLTEDQLTILPDTSSYRLSGQPKNFHGISEELVNSKTQNYRFSNTRIWSETGVYNSNFGDPAFEPQSRYSRLTFSLAIDRAFVPYISKLLIPLMIILFQVYFVFFLPPRKIDIAAGLTVTSLLSAIAFQLSFAEELPEIGYIIYVDKIFYTCYFLIAISMAQSLWTYNLDASGVPEKILKAKWIDYLFRFLFPLGFLAALFLFGITS